MKNESKLAMEEIIEDNEYQNGEIHDFNELQAAIYKTALEKEWWDEERTPPEIISLFHSELSEALEAYRTTGDIFKIWFRESDGKPEGFWIEIADAIIRMLDYAGGKDADLIGAINLKMEFNKTRSPKHGGKYL